MEREVGTGLTAAAAGSAAIVGSRLGGHPPREKAEDENRSELLEIEEKGFDGTGRGEGEAAWLLGAGAVADNELGAIEGQRTLGNLQPRAAAGLQVVSDSFAGLEPEAIDGGVLVIVAEPSRPSGEMRSVFAASACPAGGCHSV